MKFEVCRHALNDMNDELTKGVTNPAWPSCARCGNKILGIYGIFQKQKYHAPRCPDQQRVYDITGRIVVQFLRIATAGAIIFGAVRLVRWAWYL